jgi:hypothetical protein
MVIAFGRNPHSPVCHVLSHKKRGLSFQRPKQPLQCTCSAHGRQDVFRISFDRFKGQLQLNRDDASGRMNGDDVGSMFLPVILALETDLPVTIPPSPSSPLPGLRVSWPATSRCAPIAEWIRLQGEILWCLALSLGLDAPKSFRPFDGAYQPSAD